MSCSPTRSIESHIPSVNESHEETGELHSHNNNDITEIAPYHSPSPGSESGVLVDKEASRFVRTWVQQNYVAVKDHNVPRKDMFEHYKGCCTAASKMPVNSATFGKLLRLVFPDLKTRRLGVRGQSKYHYCGIRLRSGESEIVLTNEPTTPLTNTEASSTQTTHRTIMHEQPSSSSINTSSTSRAFRLPSFSIPIITSYRYSPTIDNTVAAFTAYYENHCHELLKLVATGNIEKQQECLTKFYKNMPEQYKELIETIPEVCDSIWRWDCTLFDTIIIEVLPDIQYTVSPDMMRALRKYTQELIGNLNTILTGYPESLCQKKLDIARIFTAKFRRQLALNQTAQTAASILSNPTYLEAMRIDWNHIDIDGIIDQTVWVCEYNTSFINQMLRDTIHGLIFTTPNIVYWMQWASELIDSCLKDLAPASSDTSEGYLAYSKSIITKWNLYTSMVMKDLALRNAKSFSYFMSLKIFLDDYIMFLVEENIAHVNHALVQSANQLPLPTEAFFGPSSRPEEDSPA